MPPSSPSRHHRSGTHPFIDCGGKRDAEFFSLALAMPEKIKVPLGRFTPDDPAIGDLHRDLLGNHPRLILTGEAAAPSPAAFFPYQREL